MDIIRFHYQQFKPAICVRLRGENLRLLCIFPALFSKLNVCVFNQMFPNLFQHIYRDIFQYMIHVAFINTIYIVLYCNKFSSKSLNIEVYNLQQSLQ